MIKRLLMIMGCRWDLLAGNSSFVGEIPMPPGHELYPHSLTREQIEQYVQQHPEAKAAIYNPYTVVERQNGKLVGIPYHERFKEFLEPMARDLRDAAALSPDAAFAKFLRLRADALMSDDYYPSDLAWLDLKDPKIDVIFAPYETYLDDLLGIKTSYGASVLVRNEEESRKLAVYQQYVPAIQEALPIDAAAKPSKRGHLTPMEVMDAPFRAGDLRHGYQAVADNLPNDARIHQEKGTKKIFFKNFMDARVTEVILPIAKLLMQPGQAEKASAEGYMASTLLHEISHELGPAFARQNGKQVLDIFARCHRSVFYSGLEEAKADVTGMFGLAWLVDHGALPKERLPEYYSSYVAGQARAGYCAKRYLPHATLRNRRSARARRDDGVQLPRRAGRALAGERAICHRLRAHARRAGTTLQRIAADGRRRRPAARRGVVHKVRQDPAVNSQHALSRHRGYSSGSRPGVFIPGQSAVGKCGLTVAHGVPSGPVRAAFTLV